MKIKALMVCLLVINAAIVVVNNSTLNIGAQATLVNDNPIPGIAPVPEDYQMGVLSGEFAVVGVRPETGDDFDLEVYTDTTYSSLIDDSTTSGDAVDFVTLEKNTWTSPPSKGVRVTKGSTSYVIEMENEIDTHSTSDTWSGSMDAFPGNPVLDLGSPGSWDDVYVYAPSILYDGTTYHMWYGGNDGVTRRIGYASSSDGIVWTKHSGNPVLDIGPGSWDDTHVYLTSVIFDGSTYHMWYSGSEGPHYRICYATSPDGISWTKPNLGLISYGGNTNNNIVLDIGTSGSWDDEYVFSPEVHYDGTTYHMWYSGLDGTYRRIGYATSANGIEWIKYSGNPVLDVGPTGSWDDYYTFIPRIVHDGSIYHMIYTGHDGSTFRIGYATSNDGISWTKSVANPVMNFGSSGSWDDRHMLYPDIYYDGTKFHMWYSGGDGSNIRIGYATTSDSDKWKKNTANPVLDLGPPGSWDDSGAYFPMVIYDGTIYKMWYGGFDGLYVRIGYATSSDGITWTKYSGNPVLDLGPSGSWEDGHVHYPYVLYDGTAYHMWYSGYHALHYRIGYASSPDGITWTKYAGNPVLDLGPTGSFDDFYVGQTSVHYDGSTFHMWYSGLKDGGVGKTGYATSSNGISWIKYSANPVLNTGLSGSWDDYRAYAPSVVYEGNTYHMWYSGNDRSTYKIGYTSSSDGITWTKNPQNPVLDLGPSGSWDDISVGACKVIYDGTRYQMWYSGGDGSNSRTGLATYSIKWTKLAPRNEVLDAYEIIGINSGSEYTIDMEVPSSADLDMFIYDSLGGRNDALASSTNIGGGIDESITFTAPSSGDYLLVVTNENDGTGEYTIIQNRQPEANASDDQVVNEGDMLFLDGSESKAGVGLLSKEGLVSYWKFDEGIGDIAYDSHDGNDGDVHGSVWTMGQVNDSLQFDGYNDYVDCGDDNSLKISGSLTVETWVKYSGYTGASGTGIFPNIVSNADYALSSHKQDWKGFFLSSVRNYPSPSRDGKIRFSVLKPYEVEQIQSPKRYDDGKWHYIAGVFEPNSYISLYVDGEIVANRSTTFSSFTPGTFPLSIGRGSENDVFHYFGGSIDEVAIYNRALNQNEIRCHYDNGLLGKGYFEGSCGSPRIISYEWDFESDGTYDYQETTSFAPDGTFDGITAHTYGDNGIYVATLRVTDTQNLTDTDTCNITVLNVPPSVTLDSPKMDVEIILRVAGSKWSNVGMTLFEDETQIGYIEVERWPGSPDDNPYYVNPSLPTSLDMTKSYRAIVTYDPYPDSGDEIRGDQPNNGKDKQDNAGNPVWVVMRFPNGSEERAHHTFNTQQSQKRNSDHWNHKEPWEVDIMELIEGHTFEVSSHVTDPGSDDITLTYTYGSQIVTVTYLNNPPNTDPYPSPEVNPRDIMVSTQIVYEGAGTLNLAVEDDDGGITSVNVDLK